MNNILFGVLAGLGFGIIDVLLMIPLKIEEKATAMTGARVEQRGACRVEEGCRRPPPPAQGVAGS